MCVIKLSEQVKTVIKMDVSIPSFKQIFIFTLLFQKNSDGVSKFEIQSHFGKRGYVTKLIKLWYYET
jgi:hypothetical protein